MEKDRKEVPGALLLVRSAWPLPKPSERGFLGPLLHTRDSGGGDASRRSNSG